MIEVQFTHRRTREAEPLGPALGVGRRCPDDRTVYLAGLHFRHPRGLRVVGAGLKVPRIIVEADSAGGWSAWTLASRAIERELDEKLVWVAGAAVLSKSLGAIDVFIFLALLLPISVEPGESGPLIVRNGVCG